MNILLTGVNGQLGSEIKKFQPEDIKLITPSRNDFDLEKTKDCIKFLREHKPDWLINCAAFTAVDLAETEFKMAKKINYEAVEELAKEVKKLGTRMLQISTDFVFDGNQKIPYSTSHKRNPINKYGISKALGEKAIEEILFGTNQAIILRTSWVIGKQGKNFAKTMIHLHNHKNEISVINDQIGSPTTTTSLANVCWRIIEFFGKDRKIDNNMNILHWSDEGETTWFNIANKIGAFGKNLKIIKKPAKIIKISSENYNAPARRPLYSCLDCSKTCDLLNIKQTNWETNLYEIMKHYQNIKEFSYK